MKVRKREMIIADVLAALYQSSEPLRITHLMRKANLPYIRMVQLISTLEASGLITHFNDGNKTLYCITQEGIGMLADGNLTTNLLQTAW